jgi:cytochrome b
MTKKVLVWDFPLRLFHWLFASTILLLWLTSELGTDFIDVHMQLGYFALGLLIFRISWGIVGPKHARFSQFIPSPSRLIHYIKQSKQGKTPYHAGHNPLGSLMVVLMIILILMQAISGLFINDDVFSSGPYYDVMSKDFEKVMSFIHHNTFDFMIAAIAMHLGAIFYYWRVKKQNLVLPMITGKKSADKVSKEDEIPHSKIPLAIIIVILTAAFVYWLVVTNAPVFEEFYY